MRKSRKEYSCQSEVKEHFSAFHRKCAVDRECSYIKGGLLNRYLGNEAFDEGKEYRLCRYVAPRLKGVRIPRKRGTGKKMVVARDQDFVGGTRAMRQFIRERRKCPISLTKQTKSVQVVISGCDDVVIDLTK